MPDAEPNAKAVKFPAVWNGANVIATATARDGQVDVEPVAGLVLEVPLKVWMSVAPFLTACSLQSKPD